MTPARIVGAALLGVALLGVPAVMSGKGPSTDPILATAAPSYAAAPGVARPSVGAATGSRAEVDPGWVAMTASAAGIPETAVRAYGRAILLLGKDDPSCALGWTTLAGIGWVESRHGTIDNRMLGVDGHSSTLILGPALDGTGDVAAIPSTAESAAWHGDVRWDHAVGPLQFIPSTWARWSSDGDGDGVADPNDLDDAAYAAGRYLCADGHDLGTGAGWGQAVFAYNHAQVYVDDVYAAASAYSGRTS